MAGKVIGIRMGLGYAGSVARSVDTIINAYPVKGANIPFGAFIVLNDDGTVSAISEDNERIIGVAVRRVEQPKSNTPEGWYYGEGDSADVIVRGAVMVEVDPGGAITPMSKVYVDPATGAISNDDSGTEAPGAVFSTGEVDANNIAEIVLTTRQV